MNSPDTSSAVRAVIEGEKGVNRDARVAALEKQLAKVRKDISEQERLEKRYSLVQTAFDKLKRELGKTLTTEEYNAIDGSYIFLHSGNVDMVRHIPAETSRGEDKRLETDLDTVEAMKELADLAV